MKSAFIPEEKPDLNSTHSKKTSPTLNPDHLLSSELEKRSLKLKFLKNQILAKNKTAIIIILILGNISVILLLLFIYFSL
jgi:hypothetical protein